MDKDLNFNDLIIKALELYDNRNAKYAQFVENNDSINKFSNNKPFTVHLYHTKPESLINNHIEKWNINKKIYDEKCIKMNITNDWQLHNFMPKLKIYDRKNFVICIIFNKDSDLYKIQNLFINYIDNQFMNINNFKTDIIFFCEKKMDTVRKFMNCWKNGYSYGNSNIKINLNINNTQIISKLTSLYNYINECTMKLVININDSLKIIPNNELDIMDITKIL